MSEQAPPNASLIDRRRSGQPTSSETSSQSPPGRHHPEAPPVGRRLAILTLTALGIVYGDIGTSPLYTIRETFAEEYGLAANV